MARLMFDQGYMDFRCDIVVKSATKESSGEARRGDRRARRTLSRLATIAPNDTLMRSYRR
jgi:hypothetical protein